MSVPPEMFDADYDYFYEERHGDAHSDAEAGLVAALLGVEPGMRVLDVPCGTGRIAGRLAARGCEVVGVDNSERFLATARERWPAVRFELGDMRSFGFEREFDTVLNWFTSFGYFEPETNDATLAGFARALRPGGRLVLELLNPERLFAVLDASGGVAGIITDRGEDLMADRVRYDPTTCRSITERFIVRDGRVKRLEFSLEQVPAADLERRLLQAGFDDVRLYGQDGEPFTPASRRLLAVAAVPR